jgi:2-polyprenyl-3-methyl-5-hydroxy-6-metoxy-1,4-benzoquinol methylase
MKNGDYSAKCPICHSPAPRRVYEFTDFAVLRCGACDNSWRSNMYDEEKIRDIYCGVEYESNPYFSYDVQQDATLATPRVKNYLRALDYLEPVPTAGRLLDIGCGSGSFLALAQKRGWEPHGVEMSPGLSSACERNLGTPVITGRFEDVKLPTGRFDVVTMWDVIEHVVDPGFCVRKVKELLRPGGLAVFCTPDEESILARAGLAVYKLTLSRYRYPAFALHPPYHTYFFSRKGFIRLLKDNGLTVTNCYSQEAFFEHSHLASRAQKAGIGLIEKVGSVLDSCYEMVAFARSQGAKPAGVTSN